MAFYLPQFHPTSYNDQWWGDGFTEWTLVRQARPLFRGHAQPRQAGELGYYDLRESDVRQRQADLAARYGVDCFCYWHYWFAGRRLLETPFEMVRASSTPAVRFCLAWANEDWTATWSGRPGHLLMRQTYPGESDDRAHFACVEPAFHDSRYLTFEGRPVFYLYRPLNHPDLAGFIDRWNRYAVGSGLDGIFFVGETAAETMLGLDGNDAHQLGALDAVVGVNWSRAFAVAADTRRYFRRGPLRVHYGHAATQFPHRVAGVARSFPCVLTGWDDTPRKRRRGVVLTDRTPELFAAQVGAALGQLDADGGDGLLFVKSWNEWSEGNHLEPSSVDGRVYLEAFRRAVHREEAVRE